MRMIYIKRKLKLQIMFAAIFSFNHFKITSSLNFSTFNIFLFQNCLVPKSVFTYDKNLNFYFIYIWILMSSRSSKSPSRQRSRSKGRLQKHKIFVTNLDGTAKQQELKMELEKLFTKYGSIKQLSVKKSKNGDYCFAFVQFDNGDDGDEAIKNLNGVQVKGKPMKVELQDDSKRRKDPDKGCYICQRKGHFARQCKSRNTSTYRDRRRSRSYSEDRQKKRKRRYSGSSQRERSESRHKKDKKKGQKDKKKKKDKKRRRRSSSDSRS